MGVVYAAEDTRLGRRVAMKFLSEEMARRGGQALERFEREARAASALNHPNIATVYDVGTHEGRPYLVMELVEGQALDVKLRDRRLDVATLLDWAIQIADALDAAHAKGIVHRDVKPANVLINARGQVKVLDFGLAKVAEPATAGGGMLSAGPTVDELLTSPGVAVGTVSYMSPEQARGEELDARSDIFSLGCVIYEMAAGRRAFEGKTPAVVFHAILQLEPTPLGEVNPGVPAKLEEIVAKALEKDREMRYQTAAELRADLKRLRRDLESGRTAAPVASPAAFGPSTSTAPPAVEDSAEKREASSPRPAAQGPASRRERIRELRDEAIRLRREDRRADRQWHWIPPAVALALAAVLAYRIFSRPSAPPASTPPNVSAPFPSLSVTRLTSSEAVWQAAISQDGRYVAYSTIEKSGKFGLFIRQIATRSTVELRATQGRDLWLAGFSPDGSFVYYVESEIDNSGNLYRIPSLGGVPQLVAAGVWRNASISFDGGRVAYVGHMPGEQKYSLIISGLGAATGTGTGEPAQTPRALVRDVDPAALIHPVWSPDGKTLAWIELRPDPTGLQSRVVTVGAAGGEAKPLGGAHWSGTEGALAWLPDGSGLLLDASKSGGAEPQVWFVSYPAGDARQLTGDLLEHRFSLSVAGDGKSFVGIETDRTSNLWLLPKDEEKQARQISTGHDEGRYGLGWTADGRVVYASSESGPFQIWVMDAAGTTPHQLTADSNLHAWPTVCAGVDRVFYTSDAANGYQLWSVGLEGGQVRQESHAPEQFFSSECSPDGAWFAGLSAPQDPFPGIFSVGSLVRMERESGQMRVLFEGQAYLPAISPDGKHVAFLYRPAAEAGGAAPGVRIGIVSSLGGPLEKSLQAPTVATYSTPFRIVRWTPDGHSVAYLAAGGNAFNLWAQAVKGGAPKQLTHFTEGMTSNFAWSRDGKQLVLSRGSISTDVVLFSSAR